MTNCNTHMVLPQLVLGKGIAPPARAVEQAAWLLGSAPAVDVVHLYYRGEKDYWTFARSNGKGEVASDAVVCRSRLPGNGIAIDIPADLAGVPDFKELKPKPASAANKANSTELLNTLWDRATHPPARNATTTRHVLHLIPWMKYGGAGKGTVDVLRGVDRDSFELHYLTTLPNENRWEHLVSSSVTDCAHLPDFLPKRMFIPFILYYCLTRQIDVVHIMHSLAGYDAARHLRRYLPGITMIDQLHAIDPTWRSGVLGFPDYSRHASRYLNLRTVTSKRLGRWLEGNVPDTRNRIEVIYTCVDAKNEFNPTLVERGATRRRFGIPDDVPLVVFIGRLLYQKRPELFVKIFADIASRVPNVYALMVGDGELRPSTEKEIETHGLAGRCIITGEYSEMASVYRDADLMLMCSAYEGLAYVSYEAMAMSLPQVFSDVDAQGELIGPAEGILVRTGDGEVQRFADAAVKLLLDDEGRVRMGVAARKKVLRDFPIEKNVESYVRIYAEAGRTGCAQPLLVRLGRVMRRFNARGRRLALPSPLSVMLKQCDQAQRRRVAFYGAGKCAQRLLSYKPVITALYPQLRFVALIDDNPQSCGKVIDGIPVIPSHHPDCGRLDALIIASDSVEEQLFQKAQSWVKNGATIFRPFKGRQTLS